MFQITDPLAYPLGDAQKWIGVTVCPPRLEFVKVEDSLRLLRDIESGLPFLTDGKSLAIARHHCLSHQHDVFDARYYRLRLKGQAPGEGQVLAVPFFCQSGLERFAAIYPPNRLDWLKSPIVDYHASSTDECKSILQKIETTLKAGPYFKKLWLRGQRREYRRNASFEMDSLASALQEDDVPSLLPSLGRYAENSPGLVDHRRAMLGASHWWKKPFLIWVIRSNPEWLRHYPEFVHRIGEALRSDNDDLFGKILYDIQFDQSVPTEVDDLRQWFFAFFKYSTWVLVLQQHGYLASMLDLTWDLDTALFFTHAEMRDGKFVVAEPSEGRLLYVFCESKESSSLFDAKDMDWGDADWSRSIPARITAQRCGCLTGAASTARNLYGQLVVARIWLHGADLRSTRTTEEVFPAPGDDLLFKTLLESRPRPEGLY